MMILPVVLLAAPFLQSDVAQRDVVFLVGEGHYGSAATVPAFAAELEERLDVDTRVVASEGRNIPDLSVLDEADLVVFFLRERVAEPEQLAALDAWLAQGKPAVALRTTSHAFDGVPEWFPPHFGGRYGGNAPNDAGTLAAVDPTAADHPIVRDVPRVLRFEGGGTYDVQSLLEHARVVMLGKSGELPAQPVAWTYEPRPGVRRFYTSLGAAENFEHAGFRTLLVNAVRWGLEGGGAALLPIDVSPAPPRLQPLEGATLLPFGSGWQHWDSGLEPRATALEAIVQATPRTGEASAPRWTAAGGALVARPGFGDVLTKEEYGDVHVHLDFRVPKDPDWFPPELRGSSGVFVAGRWEVVIADSRGRELGQSSCGAIAGYAPPLQDAARAAGEWQTLDVTYAHRAGEPARISVWLNDVLVQDRAEVDTPSPHGFLAPVPGARSMGGARYIADPARSLQADFGARAFAIEARFKTTKGGTLVAKCPQEGEWVSDAKAVFLRGGRLVYDIGWVGAVTSERKWNDGEWHTAVITSDAGRVRMFVDGKREAEEEDFARADEPDFVFKVGDANEDFGGRYEGELAYAKFYDRKLSKNEGRKLSQGTELEDARLTWRPASDSERAGRPADAALVAPLRLQAEASRVAFANVWTRPLGPVDHAGLIATLDEDARASGEKIYGSLCVQCHGADGTKTLNPKARPFALGKLENGADPLSLFGTITNGFRDMPSHDLLRPGQRYDVVHYLRESFLRERNPSQYFQVTGAYLNGLPKGLVRRPPLRDDGPRRDFGPALASQLGDEVGTCLSVRLDEDVTLAYDLQVMQSPGVWTGGFLDLSKTQHYQQRGEGKARIEGTPLPELDGWGWGFGGEIDWDRSRRPPRGLLPKDWLDYRGHYVHGDSVVLSYAIDGRDVLEVPGLDRTTGLPIVTHRLWVAPGETPLVLGVVRAPGGEGKPVWHTEEVPAAEGQRAVSSIMVLRNPPFEGPRFALTALLDGEGDFELTETGRLVLRIPASEEPLEYWILRASARSSSEARAFGLVLDNRRAEPVPPSARELIRGGPARFDAELVTEGKLAKGALEKMDGYALDTLRLPESNPWNAWLRTSALDFFSDGRAVVTTLGGDAWIVSGIDADLSELRWRRFASGMFEPLGVRVVGDQIYVTCRDRITRLHDENGDGEADFYESFFADPDVSTNFHAFNFDLQTDAQGNFYYAKSGQYTDYALPGAILRVAPDGKSHNVYATGLRTPNGMGMSPDGRPLVSDNQGNWIPASKVSLTREGGFYGVFKSINTSGAGKKTRDDFDQPVLWMPQSFDSSSGGQLFVDDARWGPLAGRYIHTSFGKGWMYPLWVEDTGKALQGGAWRLPLQFAAGIQRARVNPADGQVYAVGLSGWQGPAGGADGCFQRVRYTGAAGLHLLETRTVAGGFELVFSAPLDGEAAGELERYRVRRWNYRWARSYGSQHYSVASPDEVGEDELAVVAAEAAGNVLRLRLADVRPADQVELELDVAGTDGTRFSTPVYLTVHDVPDR
ncbi:MAG: DUF1080 domain-containing protein [bacterium]|nr:DUF1080 domain-containing protein [bacterium]